MPTICLVNVPLPDEAFHKAGWDVVRFRPDVSELDIRQALEEAGHPSPDLLVQAEILGTRVLLQGLESLDCPTIFWSLDTHLNLYWQTHYARLFDGLLTTQPAWMESFRTAGCTAMAPLTWCGHERPFTPWTERTHDIAFVGRISGIRPVRRWLIELLQTRMAPLTERVETQIDFWEMFGVYEHARMVPNESIQGEINMRLFEAASCGCLVLAQAIPEQDRFFTPGVHVAVQRDALELMDIAAHYRAHPNKAERMGRAARDHVLAHHLPQHRAADLLAFGSTLSRNRLTGSEATEAYWKAAFQLATTGRIKMSPARLNKGMKVFPPDEPDTMAMRIRLLYAERKKQLLPPLLAEGLAGNVHPDHLELNLTFSGAALALDDFPTARQYWYRQARAMQIQEHPETPVELYLAWARLLRKHNRARRPDFTFDSTHHLPACAMDCLISVMEKDEVNREAARLQAAILPQSGGFEAMRIGCLSVLTLHDRQDWRTSLRLGLANLEAYRLNQGMEELFTALETARSQGREKMFYRMLNDLTHGPQAVRALGLSNPGG